MYIVVVYVMCLGGYRDKVVILISQFSDAVCSIHEYIHVYTVIIWLYNDFDWSVLISYSINVVKIVNDTIRNMTV